ncbi:tripartite tricarboxylate transporter substrate binding protein [Enterovirga rhinocerotis]|uniref:tripartite tricarboxylate transporter substrate binding protein n=1 Tax=Enterovirga rhinocerotis TaxID=1339210 RepID=UPI001414DBD4|nr:tripartite tricarboxylate transporter substrate binding protein [Enterovirga rhinocerotis]
MRIVVPYAPGGSAELQARAVGEQLSKIWKQPVIIENRPGAGTTIGAATVASAPADGYTLYLAGTSHTVSPSLYRNLSYDAAKSFAAVSQISTSPFIVLVNPKLGVKTIEDLIALAKRKPGELNYGTSGVGAGPHLSAEILAFDTKINVRHVPFKGSAPAVTALLGQHVDFVLGDVSALPLVEDGSLKALAVTGLHRSARLPDVPTLAESVAPGFEVTNWSSILAPAATPAEIVSFINKSMADALVVPEVRRAYDIQGFEVAPNRPEEMQAKIISEARKYADVIARAGIKND